jgi:hypothetical protein
MSYGRFFESGQKIASNGGISIQNVSTPQQHLQLSTQVSHHVANLIENKATQRFFDLSCCCQDICSQVLVTFCARSTSR